jgi:recombination protein RecA
MSSAMVSAAAAQGRLFFSGADANPADVHPEVRALPDQRERTGTLGHFFQSTLKNHQSKILAGVTSASHLAVRPAPEMLSSGIAAINALTGGWPRGCLTEICGPASSGRTTLLLAALAAATRHGEFCVLVDASDALDPCSAADAGVELDRLLWVRCGEDAPQKLNKGCPISRASFAREVGIFSQPAFHLDRTGLKKTDFKENRSKETGWEKTRLKENRSEHRLEQALHATDLLLESGGFGLVVLDLSDLPPQQARRIPLTTWFRFRRAVENTSTVLLAIEQHPIAGSCSSLQLQLAPTNGPIHGWNNNQFAAGSLFPKPGHAHLLTGLEVTAELMRSRLERKPSRSTAAFASKTAWAG